MPPRTRGQASATAFVAGAVASGRVPHAILLAGPRGVGKTTLALDLAAGLLCLAPTPAERPCWQCPACRKVDHGTHPDVHRIGPEGAGEQIRIGQVQTLAADLALLPLEGRARVAIVEAAHRMNPDAQNALLKTLEEPAPATCIVLCADDTATLLPTVVSRAARIRMAPMPVAAAVALIGELASLDPARARSLAIAAGGRPGVALTLLRRPEATLARARLARNLLDLAGAPARERLAATTELVSDGAHLGAALRDEDAPSGRRPAPAERRRAVLAILDVWRAVGRDLAVASLGRGQGVRDTELLDDLLAFGRRIDRADLGRFLERLDGLAAAVEAYASPELALDALLLAWPRAEGAA
jgi:DNA polymerase III delta' subunit